MTTAQKRLRELRERQSKERGRMADLSREDNLTDETRAELDTIEQGTADLERQIRAATTAIEDEEREAKIKGATDQPDAELRERIELRSRASLGKYLIAAMRGKMVDGAEAELAQAAGVDGIPLELWNVPRPGRGEQRQASEQRDITPAPGTTGINLDVLRPQVFAPSVIDRLLVDMPMVESGTYATGTISTAATADAVAKGADVPETAGGFTVQSTTPHRIGASLNLAVEDIAAVGQANFESVLREHISLVLSDELDDQLLNGGAANDDLNGFFQRLDDPTVAPAAVTDFDGFAAGHASGIDGLWAGELMDVSIVCGPATMELSAKNFQSAANYKGEMSAAAYAEKMTGGWWTNKRMPDAETFLTVDDVQAAIMCRKGRAMMPNPMRLAVVPHWGYISIDDIYSGALSGARRYVLSVLVGDLILVQPAAYQQIAYKTA